jgi:hypothetical protein
MFIHLGYRLSLKETVETVPLQMVSGSRFEFWITRMWNRSAARHKVTFRGIEFLFIHNT